jgi:hypothetical protein
MLRCAVNRYHAYHDPVCCQHDEVTARGITVLPKLRRKFCPVSISRKTYSFASASAIAEIHRIKRSRHVGTYAARLESKPDQYPGNHTKIVW